MSTFQYIARDSAGKQITGAMEAGSQREVLQKLSDDELFTVKINESRAPLQLTQHNIRARHAAIMFSQLADLLNSGVPLLRSLEILDKQSSNQALSKILTQVRSDVADGSTLAEAMSKHPGAFSELAISMIRAGEEGGFLEDVLQRISDFLEHQEELKGKVTGALAYPLFLICVTVVVLTIMMVFFVPRFEGIFARLREAGELPAITEMLLGTSKFIQGNYLLIGVGVLLAIAAGRSYFKSDAGRLSIDRFKLRMPGFKNVWRGLAIARFARILGTMLANGIPILTSLRISKDSTGNLILAQAIDRAADNVTSGNALATPLRASGEFPMDIIEMIAIGEESNNLENVLVGIADTTERRITRQLDLLVRLLEPILLLVMSGLTLFVVAALLLPVFRMSALM